MTIDVDAVVFRTTQMIEHTHAQPGTSRGLESLETTSEQQAMLDVVSGNVAMLKSLGHAAAAEQILDFARSHGVDVGAAGTDAPPAGGGAGGGGGVVPTQLSELERRSIGYENPAVFRDAVSYEAAMNKLLGR